MVSLALFRKGIKMIELTTKEQVIWVNPDKIECIAAGTEKCAGYTRIIYSNWEVSVKETPEQIIKLIERWKYTTNGG